MKNIVPSAAPADAAELQERVSPETWNQLMAMGKHVALAVFLMMFKTGLLNAQGQEQPLTPAEVTKLAQNLGAGHYPSRAIADKELTKRLSYESMLLLAPHTMDPVLERKRRAKDIVEKRSPDIFKKNFPLDPEVDLHWLYKETRRPFVSMDPKGCAHDLYLIGSQLDQDPNVKKADATEKSDWKNYRLKLRMALEKIDLEERSAIPLWSNDIVKQWESFQRTNPQADKVEWNKTRFDAHMKSISIASRERVKFFMDESDTWRDRNKHKPKQKDFKPVEEPPPLYHPGPGWPRGPGFRLPGLWKDGVRRDRFDPDNAIAGHSTIHTAKTKSVLSQ